VEPKVPDFLIGTGKGWLTAEYNMLPGSTSPRKQRERAKPDGRSVEIQRLIGRSLRAIVNLNALGERTLWIDCDVLQADGGTRVTSISGAYLALRMALGTTATGVVRDSVAAVSIGICEGEPVLDLNYLEDRDADVDMNLVMTGSGQLIEIQAGGEEATFSTEQFNRLLALGQQGIAAITAAQRTALATLGGV
jgi:ribonuclease PH